MSPLDIARRIDGRRFAMDPQAMSIVWNRNNDGQVWVALECRRLRALDGSGEVLDGLDGHVSLYNLRHCPAAEDLAARLRARLTRLHTERLWHGLFVLEVEYSQEDYAWCHIVVTTFLHSTLHNLAAIAQELLGQAARRDFKQAYHCSFRWPRF